MMSSTAQLERQPFIVSLLHGKYAVEPVTGGTNVLSCVGRYVGASLFVGRKRATCADRVGLPVGGDTDVTLGDHLPSSYVGRCFRFGGAPVGLVDSVDLGID